MTTNVYYRQGLTGGAATDLDAVDGDLLNDNDAAIVFDGSTARFYLLDATSGAAEASPNIIAPDTNPGNKRWILQDHSLGIDTQTLTIGSGGNYATLNDALDDLATRMPVDAGGVTVTLEIQSGETMAEQVLVNGIDFGWVRITSVDATVTIDRSALTTSFGGGFPAFGVTNGGMLPRIHALFNMDASGTAAYRRGVRAFGPSSRAFIAGGAGVKSAGGVGCYASQAALVVAGSSDFRDAGLECFQARGAAIIYALDSTGSGAGADGYLAADSGKIEAQGADGSGAASNGFAISDGGLIHAGGATGTLSVTANNLTAAGIIFQ